MPTPVASVDRSERERLSNRFKRKEDDCLLFMLQGRRRERGVNANAFAAQIQEPSAARPNRGNFTAHAVLMRAHCKRSLSRSFFSFSFDFHPFFFYFIFSTFTLSLKLCLTLISSSSSSPSSNLLSVSTFICPKVQIYPSKHFFFLSLFRQST